MWQPVFDNTWITPEKRTQTDVRLANSHDTARTLGWVDGLQKQKTHPKHTAEDWKQTGNCFANLQLSPVQIIVCKYKNLVTTQKEAQINSNG